MVSCVGLWFLYVWFCVYCDGFCGFCTCLGLLVFVGFDGFVCTFSCLRVLGLWGCFKKLGRIVIFFIWVFFWQVAYFQALILVFPSGFGFFLLFLGRLLGFCRGGWFWVLFVPLSMSMCLILWGFLCAFRCGAFVCVFMC